ncbi:MAG: ABC transporter substrate-binding protein [Rhodocyclales bacterium]|nr:ABC transporter substrate-binding protein [Rhodocyclales bacterium]
MKSLTTVFILALSFLLSPAATAATGPDELVRKLSNEVLDIIRTEKAKPTEDAKRLVAQVEAAVSPHFDFRRMTMLAVGRDWRQATPEQQQRLVDSFYRMLVRTYSNALTQYRNQTVAFKPARFSPEDTVVHVQTEIRQSGTQPINVDYVLQKSDSGWRIFDVVVAGVSLVTNYRGSFAQEIRAGGIEGLIRALEAREREIVQGSSGQS